MTAVVGLDLAWSGRNPSGYCVLRVSPGGGASVEAIGDCVMPVADAFAWLQSLGPDVVVGVDAPLVIGGARRAEAEMARAYPGTGLYAYSARWDFLSRHGLTAGPELGALLDRHGWRLDPACLPPWPRGRWALEVFPHGVAVSLLGSASILRYKKGPREARLNAFNVYQRLLRECAVATLGASCALVLEGVLGVDASVLRGKHLKAHEDGLDAVACALAAWVAFQEGAKGLRVFGDATEGYIAVPRGLTCAQARSCP